MFYPTYDTGISVYSNRLKRELINQGINIIKIPLQSAPIGLINLVNYIKQKNQYTKIGKKMNQAEIAHIQFEYSFFGGVNPVINMYQVFSSQIKIPKILTIHEITNVSVDMQEGSNIKKFIKKLAYGNIDKYLQYINKGIFQEADAIIVHTNSTKEILVKRGINSNKIFHIEHGIPYVNLSSKRQTESKKALGLENKIVITTFGSISERKGQDQVIKILDKLPENVIYLIAGALPAGEQYTTYMNNINKVIREKHLENKVKLTGYVQNNKIPEIMNATDLIVYPARDIIASGSVTETMAYEKMIIASNLDFINEINLKYECIKTYKKNDINNLQNIIEDMIKNPSKKKKYIENTKRYAKEYSFKNIALKTKVLYNQVLTKYNVEKKKNNTRL